VTQECLHTINTKKLNALILKMDLVKAHDRVNWVFLRLVLLRIGLPLEVTDSIMACVTATCFAFLVNCSSIKNFKCSTGLSKVCPLSPLIFLLVIEGLSRIIGNAKREGKLKGVKIIATHFITHL